jgi:hypothetical protein
MVQVCPRCQRANPQQAVFCHFDGVVLRQGAVVAGLPAAQMTQEFVFPSKRRCRTIDELVQGCQYEWEDARELLQRGDFARFLSRIGRMDLARAAEEAQAQDDPDIALHNFVSNLPASQVQGPRLDLNPRRVQLGKVKTGDQRQLRLIVANQGKGLLQGKLTVSEGGQWLHADGSRNGSLALKASREQEVLLRIDARGLVAPQTYSGKLTVITNGGIAEVPVRLDVVATPFPRPPFQGASSPRAMAERMRANPKPAVPLLETGEIARWFAVNGWSYPVGGATARGVAAVQQFFECMGLSKPPPLQVSDSEVRFLCTAPEVVRGEVVLRTGAKKWVYAMADSDVPWLKVITPAVSGPQQAPIAFEVDSGLLDENKIHEGSVLVVANAGQRFAVRVRVDVRRPHEPFTRRLLRPFLAGALLALVFRLFLAGPADVWARVLASTRDDAGTLARWAVQPIGEEGFLKHLVLAMWWLGGVLGIGLVWKRGGRLADLFCGALAGAGAGLVGSATLGCLLVLFDALPRAVAARLVDRGWEPSVWVATPVWIALTVGWWTLGGGGIGFLLCGLGQRGARVLAALASPLAWVCRVCGMERVATLFAMQ